MPSESTPTQVIEQAQTELSQSQAKICSTCHTPLNDQTNVLLIQPDNSTIVCRTCRERLISVREGPLVTNIHDFYPSRLVANPVETRPPVISIPDDDDLFQQDSDIVPAVIYHRAPSSTTVSTSTFSSPQSQSQPKPPPSFHSNTNPRDGTSPVSHHKPLKSATSTIYDYGDNEGSPDPLIDITRLRVRSHGRHCLYPGASFRGTQKSGRNSYDVTVTIVDVDFSSSFLCGYLRIQGLTDDWPELTTYFDAEIIGSRHGFLTQNWGATESEDMVHWSRFPAFRNVKGELKQPHMTMSDRDRGAVFMRWKERFLVPDHRVQDISGASFAGFYYVCVDFNPPVTKPGVPLGSEGDEIDLSSPLSPIGSPTQSFVPPPKTEGRPRGRRDSSVRRAAAPVLAPRSAMPAARMSGFYYHQNSEPYQQLSLNHVPERTTSTFEFR